MLWQRETSAAPLDTPERRAAFEARIDTLLGEIGNTRVKDHYRREVKNRLFHLWREQPARPRGAAPRHGRQSGRTESRNIESRKPVRRDMAPPASAYGFATIVTLALVNHPWLLDRFGEEVGSIEVKDRALAALLGDVTRAIFADASPTSERLIAALEQGPHAKLWARLFRESPFKRIAFLQPETKPEEVETQFAEVIYRWRALPTLNREIEESADQLADMSEAEFERFATLQQQVASIGQHHDADDAGERDANQRFDEMLARLKREPLTKGRRAEKRH
jgi:DNA primase